MCLKYCFHVSLVVSHPFAWGRLEGGGFEDKAPVQLFSEEVWSAAFLWLSLCSYFFVCTARLLPSFGEKWTHCFVHSRLSATGFLCDSSTHHLSFSWTTILIHLIHFCFKFITESWGWLIWGFTLLFWGGINSLWWIYVGLVSQQSYLIQKMLIKTNKSTAEKTSKCFYLLVPPYTHIAITACMLQVFTLLPICSLILFFQCFPSLPPLLLFL